MKTYTSHDNYVETCALMIAQKAHSGQFRKFTNESYIWHPISVAHTLKKFGYKGEIIAAALLHDVLEDTSMEAQELALEVPAYVVNLVLEVTDVSTAEDGTRDERKAIDREHLAKASFNARAIKMADMMDNLQDIVENNPKFAVTYVKEKRKILELDNFKVGNELLYQAAMKVLEESEQKVAHYESKK